METVSNGLRELPTSSDLTVDTKLPVTALHEQIKFVCKALVHSWRDVALQDMTVSTITGGITNFLVKVSVVNTRVAETDVALRVFGPNTDVVIDRKREIEALSFLSAAGFGAKLIGIFTNGLVQSFIDAETLKPEDMGKPALVPLIAKELRRLHDANIPISRKPEVWQSIHKFLDEASAITFSDEQKQQRFETISFDELKKEVNILQEVTDSLDSPVIFAHNDLLSGNIMYDQDAGKVHFIDFEYGSYNYRGYDIGNHFNEYAGLDCDFSLYPEKDVQYQFFRSYLYPSSPEKATEDELEALYVETNCYALASHIFWAVWGIIQAKFSPIDFDYLEYFFLRYNEYRKRKVEFISQALSFLAKRCTTN